MVPGNTRVCVQPPAKERRVTGATARRVVPGNTRRRPVAREGAPRHWSHRAARGSRQRPRVRPAACERAPCHRSHRAPRGSRQHPPASSRLRASAVSPEPPGGAYLPAAPARASSRPRRSAASPEPPRGAWFPATPTGVQSPAKERRVTGATARRVSPGSARAVRPASCERAPCHRSHRAARPLVPLVHTISTPCGKTMCTLVVRRLLISVLMVSSSCAGSTANDAPPSPYSPGFCMTTVMSTFHPQAMST